MNLSDLLNKGNRAIVLYPLSFLRSQRVWDGHAFGSDPLSGMTLGSETHSFDLSFLKVVVFLKTKCPNPAFLNGIL